MTFSTSEKLTNTLSSVNINNNAASSSNTTTNVPTATNTSNRTASVNRKNDDNNKNGTLKRGTGPTPFIKATSINYSNELEMAMEDVFDKDECMQSPLLNLAVENLNLVGGSLQQTDIAIISEKNSTEHSETGSSQQQQEQWQHKKSKKSEKGKDITIENDSNSQIADTNILKATVKTILKKTSLSSAANTQWKEDPGIIQVTPNHFIEESQEELDPSLDLLYNKTKMTKPLIIEQVEDEPTTFVELFFRDPTSEKSTTRSQNQHFKLNPEPLIYMINRYISHLKTVSHVIQSDQTMIIQSLNRLDEFSTKISNTFVSRQDKLKQNLDKLKETRLKVNSNLDESLRLMELNLKKFRELEPFLPSVEHLENRKQFFPLLNEIVHSSSNDAAATDTTNVFNSSTTTTTTS